MPHDNETMLRWWMSICEDIKTNLQPTTELIDDEFINTISDFLLNSGKVLPEPAGDTPGNIVVLYWNIKRFWDQFRVIKEENHEKFCNEVQQDILASLKSIISHDNQQELHRYITGMSSPSNILAQNTIETIKQGINDAWVIISPKLDADEIPTWRYLIDHVDKFLMGKAQALQIPEIPAVSEYFSTTQQIAVNLTLQTDIEPLQAKNYIKDQILRIFERIQKDRNHRIKLQEAITIIQQSEPITVSEPIPIPPTSQDKLDADSTRRLITIFMGKLRKKLSNETPADIYSNIERFLLEINSGKDLLADLSRKSDFSPLQKFLDHLISYWNELSSNKITAQEWESSLDNRIKDTSNIVQSMVVGFNWNTHLSKFVQELSKERKTFLHGQQLDKQIQDYDSLTSKEPEMSQTVAEEVPVHDIATPISSTIDATSEISSEHRQFLFDMIIAAELLIRQVMTVPDDIMEAYLICLRNEADNKNNLLRNIPDAQELINYIRSTSSRAQDVIYKSEDDRTETLQWLAYDIMELSQPLLSESSILQALAGMVTELEQPSEYQPAEELKIASVPSFEAEIAEPEPVTEPEFEEPVIEVAVPTFEAAVSDEVPEPPIEPAIIEEESVEITPAEVSAEIPSFEPAIITEPEFSEPSIPEPISAFTEQPSFAESEFEPATIDAISQPTDTDDDDLVILFKTIDQLWDILERDIDEEEKPVMQGFLNYLKYYLQGKKQALENPACPELKLIFEYLDTMHERLKIEIKVDRTVAEDMIDWFSVDLIDLVHGLLSDPLKKATFAQTLLAAEPNIFNLPAPELAAPAQQTMVTSSVSEPIVGYQEPTISETTIPINTEELLEYCISQLLERAIDLIPAYVVPELQDEISSDLQSIDDAGNILLQIETAHQREPLVQTILRWINEWKSPIELKVIETNSQPSDTEIEKKVAIGAKQLLQVLQLQLQPDLADKEPTIRAIDSESFQASCGESIIRISNAIASLTSSEQDSFYLEELELGLRDISDQASSYQYNEFANGTMKFADVIAHANQNQLAPNSNGIDIINTMVDNIKSFIRDPNIDISSMLDDIYHLRTLGLLSLGAPVDVEDTAALLWELLDKFKTSYQMVKIPEAFEVLTEIETNWAYSAKAPINELFDTIRNTLSNVADGEITTLKYYMDSLDSAVDLISRLIEAPTDKSLHEDIHDLIEDIKTIETAHETKYATVEDVILDEAPEEATIQEPVTVSAQPVSTEEATPTFDVGALKTLSLKQAATTIRTLKSNITTVEKQAKELRLGDAVDRRIQQLYTQHSRMQRALVGLRRELDRGNWMQIGLLWPGLVEAFNNETQNREIQCHLKAKGDDPRVPISWIEPLNEIVWRILWELLIPDLQTPNRRQNEGKQPVSPLIIEVAKEGDIVKVFIYAEGKGQFPNVKVIADIEAYIKENLEAILKLNRKEGEGLKFEIRLNLPTSEEELPSDEFKPNIIVADHSQNIRLKLKALLEKTNYKVHEVSDGRSLMDILAVEHIDAIIMDIELAYIHGLQLLPLLRRGARTQALPIIVVTSHVGQKINDRINELGVQVLLTKPVKEDEIIDAMQSLVPTI